MNDKLKGKIGYVAAKSIGDAPNLRDRFNAACLLCAHFQPIEGALTNEGVCTLYDFATNMDYVCDSFEAAPPPEVVEQVAEALVEAVAEMPSENMMSAYGSEIKSLDGGRIGGYLVRFGSPQETDGDGEYFDATTDFGFSKGEEITTPIWLNHCQPLETSNHKAVAVREPLGNGTLKMVDDGIVIDAILYERAKYEKYLDALGWSSGTAVHTLKKSKNGKAVHIDRWHLGLDASLTPKPADSRNAVISIKSLQNIPLTANPEAEAEAGVATLAPQATVTASEQTNLTQSAVKAAKEKEMEADMQTILTAVNETSSNVKSFTARLDAVEKALKAEPPANDNRAVTQVISDPADRPFKSIAEQCLAVRDYTVSMGQKEAPRLKFLKHWEAENSAAWKAITGASESVPTDGGLLLDPTLSDQFIAPVHDAGVFSAKAQRLPVGGNSNFGWINGIDETSRVTGSRWGGIRGYRGAEGDAMTASKPAFRRIAWELKEYFALVYSTDQLLADAAMFSKIVNQGCREEIGFMINDDIFEGIGLSGAQGLMNSGALITVQRETATNVLHADIVRMWNRMDPHARKTAEWYINNDVQPQLDQLYFTGTTSVLSPFVSYRPDGVMTIYGRPVNVTEFNQSLNTTGDIVLADMNQYLMWEKTDIQEATSIHVAFLTNQTVFRFTYRADGKSSLASALTPFHGSTTTSPFVCLGSASA